MENGVNFFCLNTEHTKGMSENRRTPQDTAVNEIKHYYKIKNRTSADKADKAPPGSATVGVSTSLQLKAIK